MFKAGPVGTTYLGSDEKRWDHKGRTMISHIFIAYDDFVRSIQFGYLENGCLVMSEKYGPTEGYSFRVVRLNPDEYVTGLSGVSGDLYKCGERIRNLTFHTNRGKHGPIGCSRGINRSSAVEIDPAILDPREFGGFFGSYSEHHLLSIGMYVNPYRTSDTTVKTFDQEM